MPSLSALREFKASFNDIGNEKALLTERNISFDDLELPDTEAEPMVVADKSLPPSIDPAVAEILGGSPETGASGTPEPASQAGDITGSGPSAPDTEATPAQAVENPDDEFAVGGDFDFSDLLGSIPADLTPPADDAFADLDTPSADTPQLETLAPETGDLSGEELDLGGEELDLGDESLDLSGDLSDFEIPDESAEPAEGAPDEGLDLGGEDLDLGDESLDLSGDLSDFEIPGESAEPAEGAPDEGLDLGGEELDLGGESLDLSGDLSDFEIPGESAEPAEGAPDEGLDLGAEDLDLGGEESPDFGTGSFETEEDSGDPVSGREDLELGGDVFDMDGAETEDVPAGDAFDAFSLEGDVQPEAGLEAEAGTSDDDLGDVDFSLPGIDDLLTDSKAETKSSPAGSKARGKAKAGAKGKEAPKAVEEISLNDEELKRLRKTLSTYPLKLRIACEELIVEQAVAPDQMSELVQLLVNGAPAKETAALAGQILGRTIEIPKAFEKNTGEALEAEQATFAYIFVHNFLPVLRLFAMIAVVAASLGYLIYQFVYIPFKAESIYKIGYERIFAGEYERANERFSEAFNIKRKKDWFYRYAEAFRDERQYYRAEEKYDELLRYYPRDNKGVLDYAALETYYLFNYQKANDLLRRELLDYAPDDRAGLLALGDNNLAWGEVDPSKYEDARFAYARLLDLYGWTGPVVERMLKYFIRTDNLKEVLPLQAWFTDNKKWKLSADTLAELGGYLLDKRLEAVRGVPNEYIEQIDGIRNLLLDSVSADPLLPEAHYHLARYYNSLGSTHEERVTLEMAIQAFDNAKEESVRRLTYRIDAHRRYADVLINSREFTSAEEQLIKGINLYEDALGRRLMTRSPEYGRLYAGLGDLEYFTKTGDMEMALNYYHRSVQNGWAPPEMQYRMGAAYYQLEDWRNALEYFFTASADLPLNRRLLFALGNAALKRNDNFAAQGYYNRLLDILEMQRARLPVLLPNDRPEYLELAERLMMARNNAGVAYEALAEQTGDRRYRTRAQTLYAEANRAWDARTRDPRTMIRSGSIPLPYLNARNTLYPQIDYEPQIFIRIDRDVLEPSKWEELAPIAGF
ncbi:MAG: tetratricopeptide repeat protein [Treponema sp.]|jgi:tetratricopeptide (TPR) repeat protein|nr:tetratricopeptide repeat protein [Treponema sp.]